MCCFFKQNSLTALLSLLPSTFYFCQICVRFQPRSDAKTSFFGICVWLLFVSGASAVVQSVLATEGDSVTLHTDVERILQDRMTWFFEENRLALINGEGHKVCADDECKERFIDRLNVNQAGSLTITNVRNADSGVYKLKITSRKIEKIFNVTVHGVRDKIQRKAVKEGESVTLYTGEIKNPRDLMKWYFNETLVAEIVGDQSQICTEVECKERFRDRLKVNQTGSLTIMNIRTTDSGEYKLQISNSSFSIIRSYTVTVTDSGSSLVVAVVVVVVLLSLIIAAVAFCKRRAIMESFRSCPSVYQRAAAENNELQ
ncbi:uncharacterized protein LOC122327436 isoform X1 [Puntigrus tetrazona]|uniref:uncharacterized protein LOC122327436 isoform X1 n=2 Tax=Puntigrus tetrazona TaxID=1606681 RepID=UPI001C89E6D2|nr:uncharacterized protein LOC122327436 isoform X1 [Puntigrus tetrazona]